MIQTGRSNTGLLEKKSFKIGQHLRNLALSIHERIVRPLKKKKFLYSGRASRGVGRMSLLQTSRKLCHSGFDHWEVKISEVNPLEKNMVPRTSRLPAKCSDQQISVCIGKSSLM